MRWAEGLLVSARARFRDVERHGVVRFRYRDAFAVRFIGTGESLELSASDFE
jgi:hypothetical protein